MGQPESLPIEVTAMVALAEWKSLFAGAILRHTQQIAIASGETEALTVNHLRQAVEVAMPAILSQIRASGEADACREAA